MIRVTFSRLALKEIDAVSDYLLAEAGPQVAARWTESLLRLRLSLVDQPDQGRPTRRPETRCLAMADFPYHVLYRQIRADRVSILRVRHARRRPLGWT